MSFLSVSFCVSFCVFDCCFPLKSHTAEVPFFLQEIAAKHLDVLFCVWGGFKIKFKREKNLRQASWHVLKGDAVADVFEFLQDLRNSSLQVVRNCLLLLKGEAVVLLTQVAINDPLSKGEKEEEEKGNVSQ